MNEKQYIYSLVLSGTICINLKQAQISNVEFDIDKEYSLDFYLFLNRFWVLFNETGFHYITQSVLNLLYCLMDLKPLIFLPLLKVCVKPHQVQ
jgi:hypothetical protein